MEEPAINTASSVPEPGIPGAAIPATATPGGPPLFFDRPKKGRTFWIILGTVITTICAGMLVCVGVLIFAGGRGMAEENAVTKVLDSFMKDMSARDVEAAYALFSPRVQRQLAQADLEKLSTGNNYALFDGYQELTIKTYNMGPSVNTDPDQPQGMVARVEGAVTYEGDFTGKFSAVLEKVEDTWRLHYINITVPPDKLSPGGGNNQAG